MLQDQPWMKSLSALDIERLQAEEEGRDLEDFLPELDRLRGKSPLAAEAAWAADRLLERIQERPLRPDYPYTEPESPEEIRQARPEAPVLKPYEGTKEDLFNRVYGGLLGRCGGCLLGQPIEGWHRERIRGLLRSAGNWPVRHYISSDIPEEIRLRFGVEDTPGAYGAARKSWISNVSGMPEDDDTNYTVLALRLTERCGRDFTSDDMAEQWLMSLPLLHTCTAERAAYINLANLVLPPRSGSFHNPYREWIGAQIRGDFFGYINPGDPRKAAEMAWRDGRISHVRNGVYGEMFVSAMIAAAFVTDVPRLLVEAGLAGIPARSRLAEALRQVLDWHEEGLDAGSVQEKICERYDEKNPRHWCHVIPNAMLVACGIRYGGMDYGTSIGLGITAGFDTDCNAATIGSVIGIALGASQLPASWTEPLRDSLITGVDGEGQVQLSDLARRTLRLMPPRS